MQRSRSCWEKKARCGGEEGQVWWRGEEVWWRGGEDFGGEGGEVAVDVLLVHRFCGCMPEERVADEEPSCVHVWGEGHGVVEGDETGGWTISIAAIYT